LQRIIKRRRLSGHAALPKGHLSALLPERLKEWAYAGFPINIASATSSGAASRPRRRAPDRAFLQIDHADRLLKTNGRPTE